MEFQGKSGADFAQMRPCAIWVELVSMVAEEDEVPLVVPGDHSSLLELRILREQARNHPSHPRTEHGVKIVEDELGGDHRSIIGTVVWNFSVQADARNAECGCWTIWQMAEDQTVRLAPLFLQDHDVCEFSFFGPLNNLLDPVVFPWVVFHIWDRNLQFFQEVKDRLIINEKRKGVSK